MITYKDCPECGARKIHDTVRLCEVCETWERAEAAINAQDEALTSKYNEQLARAERAERERDEALARCETLRELADQAAAEQGLAQRRMMEAQQERDEARAEATRLRVHVAFLRSALKDYYHECRCQRTEMDEVNRAAYAALRATDAIAGGKP